MSTFKDEPPRFDIGDEEEGADETDINLRAYLETLTDAKLSTYRPSFSDEELMEWDGNFRSDGALLLVCCTRDVDAEEYRAALEELLAQRQQSAAQQ